MLVCRIGQGLARFRDVTIERLNPFALGLQFGRLVSGAPGGFRSSSSCWTIMTTHDGMVAHSVAR